MYGACCTVTEVMYGFSCLLKWQHLVLLITCSLILPQSLLCISVLSDILKHYNTHGFIFVEEPAQSEGVRSGAGPSEGRGIRVLVH